MTLTSPGIDNGPGYVVDDVYISPYTGLVNGVSTTLICDDFASDSYLGESWSATVSNVANLGSTVLGGSTNQQGYDEVAWLAEQLLSPANANLTAETDISYAMWSIFEGSSVTNYLNAWGDTATYNGAMSWVAQAEAQTFSSGEYANVLIYTPITTIAPTCGSGPCPTSIPQEFIAVTTPESPVTGLFVIDLLGLAGMVYFFRRESKVTA